MHNRLEISETQQGQLESFFPETLPGAVEPCICRHSVHLTAALCSLSLRPPVQGSVVLVV